jgi:hypothetical protein
MEDDRLIVVTAILISIVLSFTIIFITTYLVPAPIISPIEQKAHAKPVIANNTFYVGEKIVELNSDHDELLFNGFIGDTLCLGKLIDTSSSSGKCMIPFYYKYENNITLQVGEFTFNIIKVSDFIINATYTKVSQ